MKYKNKNICNNKNIYNNKKKRKKNSTIKYIKVKRKIIK